MSPDPNKKMLRQFHCRESLWQKFDQMAKELECSVDYLINDAMKQYARQRGYAGSAPSASQRAEALSPSSSVSPSLPQPEHAPPAPVATQGSGAHAMPVTTRQAGSGAHALPQPAMPQVHAPAVPTTTSGSGAHGLPQSQRYGAAPTLPGPGGPPPLPMGASRAPAPMPPPAPPAPGAKRVGPPPMPASGAIPPASHVAPPAIPPGGSRVPAPPPPLPGHHPRTLSSAKMPATSSVAATTPKQLHVRYQGQSFVVNKEKFIIGRGKQASDLTIKDPNVSRQHAMIEFDGTSYFIVDLGSTNGLEYQGQRVSRKALADGDLIRICDHELSFQFR